MEPFECVASRGPGRSPAVGDPAEAKRYSGFNLFSRAVGEQVQAHLVELLASGRIRPVVGRTAPWTDLPAELTLLANRATTGRTVLDWRA